jgi:EAL domain-containing protein (putative c-di-GMP-specific phosphodiesterase class I)
MGMKFSGEGVERKEELEFCESIGVDLAQGYFIGKPAKEPAEKVKDAHAW